MVKEEEMGSTVVIYRDENHPENETLWMPNSGLFFRTMQAMSNIVQDSNPEFAEELKQYRDNPHSHIDMSKWNSEKLKKFLEVVIRLEKNVISHLIELQKSDVHLQTIVGLKLLLNIDPRIEGEKAYLKSGSIILDDATKWKTSGWIYDCILADLLRRSSYRILEGWVDEDKSLLATIQLACQTGKLDIREFNQNQHKTVVGVICNPPVSEYPQFGAIFGKRAEKLKSDIQKALNNLSVIYNSAYPQYVHWWETGEEL